MQTINASSPSTSRTDFISENEDALLELLAIVKPTFLKHYYKQKDNF